MENLQSEKIKFEGISAIIFLQSLNGIIEPFEKAEKAWDSFSVREKKNTMMAYNLLKEIKHD